MIYHRQRDPIFYGKQVVCSLHGCGLECFLVEQCTIEYSLAVSHIGKQLAVPEDADWLEEVHFHATTNRRSIAYNLSKTIHASVFFSYGILI